MAVVDEQIVIRRSPQEVFDYLVDVSNQPKWETTVVSVSPRDGDYHAHDGAEYDYVIRVGAMKMKARSVISGLEPGHTGHYKVTSALGTVEGSYTVESHPDGALFIHHAESHPDSTVQKAVDAVTTPLFRRQVRRGAQNLKAQLEQ